MIPLSLHCAEKIENIGNIGGKILLQQKKIIFFCILLLPILKEFLLYPTFKKKVHITHKMAAKFEIFGLLV